MAASLVLIAGGHGVQASDTAQAVKLSRAYLASGDRAERRKLAKELAAYDGEIEPVLAKLSARTYERMRSGYRPEQKFWDPELRKKHPDDLLYFTVPKSYRPDRPAGLIVFMHGGSKSSSRRAPRVFMNFPGDGDTEEDTMQLGNVFEATGMIAVGPSAPWNEKSNVRWCLEESDEYIADVIADCQTRFNIDPDRVILMGHSMGGFGAYHHALRQPDRFAAVIVGSGSWKLGYWPVVRGTPLCIVHGVRDAVKGERLHYTDIAYARETDKLFTKLGLDHTYYEHDGKHGIHYGKKYFAKYLRAAKDLRRDPYYPHIALASPNGYSTTCTSAVKHNRWLTLDEATEGKLTYDELRTNGAKEFDDWKLTHTTSQRTGAAIEAVNRGDNTVAVSTQNVARFTVWLHPRMIDVKKPVKVVVNEETRFNQRVEPSLATALESYERRRDWGLIYPMKVEIDLPQ
jgi:predicted esterase